MSSEETYYETLRLLQVGDFFAKISAIESLPFAPVSLSSDMTNNVSNSTFAASNDNNTFSSFSGGNNTIDHSHVNFVNSANSNKSVISASNSYNSSNINGNSGNSGNEDPKSDEENYRAKLEFERNRVQKTCFEILFNFCKEGPLLPAIYKLFVREITFKTMPERDRKDLIYKFILKQITTNGSPNVADFVKIMPKVVQSFNEKQIQIDFYYEAKALISSYQRQPNEIGSYILKGLLKNANFDILIAEPEKYNFTLFFHQIIKSETVSKIVLKSLLEFLCRKPKDINLLFLNQNSVFSSKLSNSNNNNNSNLNSKSNVNKRSNRSVEGAVNSKNNINIENDEETEKMELLMKINTEINTNSTFVSSVLSMKEEPPPFYLDKIKELIGKYNQSKGNGVPSAIIISFVKNWEKCEKYNLLTLNEIFAFLIKEQNFTVANIPILHKFIQQVLLKRISGVENEYMKSFFINFSKKAIEETLNISHLIIQQYPDLEENIINAFIKPESIEFFETWTRNYYLVIRFFQNPEKLVVFLKEIFNNELKYGHISLESEKNESLSDIDTYDYYFNINNVVKKKFLTEKDYEKYQPKNFVKLKTFSDDFDPTYTQKFTNLISVKGWREISKMLTLLPLDDDLLDFIKRALKIHDRPLTPSIIAVISKATPNMVMEFFDFLLSGNSAMKIMFINVGVSVIFGFKSLKSYFYRNYIRVLSEDYFADKSVKIVALRKSAELIGQSSEDETTIFEASENISPEENMYEDMMDLNDERNILKNLTILCENMKISKEYEYLFLSTECNDNGIFSQMSNSSGLNNPIGTGSLSNIRESSSSGAYNGMVETSDSCGNNITGIKNNRSWFWASGRMCAISHAGSVGNARPNIVKPRANYGRNLMLSQQRRSGSVYNHLFPRAPIK